MRSMPSTTTLIRAVLYAAGMGSLCAGFALAFLGDRAHSLPCGIAAAALLALSTLLAGQRSPRP